MHAATQGILSTARHPARVYHADLDNADTAGAAGGPAGLVDCVVIVCMI